MVGEVKGQYLQTSGHNPINSSRKQVSIQSVSQAGMFEFHLHTFYCLKHYLYAFTKLIQDPVLSAEDVDKLCFGAKNKKPLSVLKKVSLS